VVVRDYDALRDAVCEWPDMREWVLQRYVPNLLLLDGERKFHLRVFVVCVGALRVHLLHEYIAFFATARFDASSDDPWTHITNAYHQRTHDAFVEAESFRASHELPLLAHAQLGLSLAQAQFEFTHPHGRVLKGIAQCVAEVFRAQKSTPNVFQPAPQLFEHFGLDFLLDGNLQPWLLEFNSGPDLEQAGDRLQPLIEKLIRGIFVLGVDQQAHDAEGFSQIYDETWAMDGAPLIR
jgi:tubulin--tyrosine ligase